MSIENAVCVSIVNHGHGDVIYRLIEKLSTFPEVRRIVLTQNVPVAPFENLGPKCLIIENTHPKGFGANHNAAFRLVTEPFFCVINPDIEVRNNPFPAMLERHVNAEIGVVGPQVLEPDGSIADSVRTFPTVFSLLRRWLWSRNGDLFYPALVGNPCKPYWIAGMFMLFKAEAFQRLGGFDERYFLYFEDVDLCRRILHHGMTLMCCTEAKVIHHAQRASRRKIEHFLWHLRSAILYFSASGK